MHFAIKIAKRLATVLIVLVLTIYFVRAFDSRDMPPLGPEHHIVFEHEFTAALEDQTDWPAYLAIENRLATELEDKIPSKKRADSPVDRFFAGSVTHTRNYRKNWNRSFEMSVPSPRGVAVLLHGLTDSPYSMRATAETLKKAGYNVVAIRMPGHGYAPGGLRQVSSEDWTATVRVAMRTAMKRPGAHESLLLVGYSNGGLLAIHYALQCNNTAHRPCPDGLVLLSPGIAIRSAAAVANWHAAISWIPFFEKFAWLTILPAVDPFKFTSFPKRAAWEVRKLSSRVHELLANPAKAAQLPPILTFQSLVDDTVSVTAIIETLYNRLPDNGSKIVIYDINRNSTMLHLMKQRLDTSAATLLSHAPFNFDVTVLKNRDRSSNVVESQVLLAGQENPALAETGLRWPAKLYSLSHIAIPFRADDPVYGDGSTTIDDNSDVVLGAVAPRGERDMLLLTPDYFLRVRYNPFFEFQSRALTEWINQLHRQ